MSMRVDRTVRGVRTGIGGITCSCCTIGTHKNHKTMHKRTTRHTKKQELAREVHNDY